MALDHGPACPRFLTSATMPSVGHWLNGDFARPPSLEVVSEAPRSSEAFFFVPVTSRYCARYALGAHGPAHWTRFARSAPICATMDAPQL